MKRILTLATATTIALVLNACGGSSSNTTSIKGKLVDSPVYGAQYRCGKVDNKITQADGSFVCETLPVTFYVGGVKLGEVHTVPEDGYVTPQDLLGVPRNNYDTAVNNLALFLQSLDDDGDIGTVITIQQKHIDKLKDKQYDIHTMTHDQVVQLLTEINTARVVTREEAKVHLQRHIEAIKTTKNPTTNNPTTNNPTTNNPTTNNPTTHNPTTNNPTTHNPTTNNPTTHNPTTNNPITHNPITNNPHK